MTEIIESPFAFQRWEEEKDHIIWLPAEFAEWEGQKSVYITGSRGTGKTTLLQGLVYSQRLKNKSIKWQLGTHDSFEKKYIGIYLSMPDYVTSQFKQWPPRKDGKSNEQWD
jgi:predicted AAA+ superfamily ATPase